MKITVSKEIVVTLNFQNNQLLKDKRMKKTKPAIIISLPSLIQVAIIFFHAKFHKQMLVANMQPKKKQKILKITHMKLQMLD